MIAGPNYLLISLLILLTFSPAQLLANDSPAGTGDFAVIRIQNRPAAELLDPTRALLGHQGRISVDRISNSLIIAAAPAAITRIKKLITRLDIPVPRITVLLRSRQSAPAGRTLSTRTGIQTHHQAHSLVNGMVGRSTSMRLSLNSGASAYLALGRDLPRTNYWLELCAQYGYRFSWIQTSQRLDTGFTVQATALPGGMVELVLEPRLDFDNGHRIRLTRAATRITVNSGTWVVVAMADASINELNSALITTPGQQNEATILEIKALISQPAGFHP